MRKILFFLLLIAGFAVIFFPLAADLPGSDVVSPSLAHPSNRALPTPWEESERFSPGSPAGGASSACGSQRILQAGETLGGIARDCSISLADLLVANPQITNANKVYAGQRLKLPDPPSGRGGGDPLEVDAAPVPLSRGFQPGSQVAVEVSGLPVNTAVRVGLGLSSSGYIDLAEAHTDAKGALFLTISLPANAQPGDEAFLLVTTQSVPNIQRISKTFTIGE